MFIISATDEKTVLVLIQPKQRLTDQQNATLAEFVFYLIQQVLDLMRILNIPMWNKKVHYSYSLGSLDSNSVVSQDADNDWGLVLQILPKLSITVVH